MSKIKFECITGKSCYSKEQALITLNESIKEKNDELELTGFEYVNHSHSVSSFFYQTRGGKEKLVFYCSAIIAYKSA